MLQGPTGVQFWPVGAVHCHCDGQGCLADEGAGGRDFAYLFQGTGVLYDDEVPGLPVPGAGCPTGGPEHFGDQVHSVVARPHYPRTANLP